MRIAVFSAVIAVFLGPTRGVDAHSAHDWPLENGPEDTRMIPYFDREASPGRVYQAADSASDGPGGERYLLPPGLLSNGPGEADHPPAPDPEDIGTGRPHGPPGDYQIASAQRHVTPPDIVLSVEDLNRSPLHPTTDPDLEARIQKALKTYQQRARRSVQTALERRANLAPIMVSAFSEGGVPLWLSNLALVESHFNPSARSSSGYVGMWQLHAETARSLGLRVNRTLDERLDPEKSTRAVVKLLSQHYKKFNDWELSVAAYTTGGFRIQRALNARPGADLAELVQRGLLSSVLLDQVAQVHAASRIVDDPERHGFKANPQRFDQTLTREIQRVMGTVGLQP